MSSGVSIPGKNELIFEKVKYQFLASICANVIVLAQGCSVKWMSPSLLVLLSEDSPLVGGKLTLEAASWIGSLFSLGAAVGVFFFETLSLFIGNKRSMLLCAFPITMFWFTVIYAQHPWHLSVGRFTTGLTGGSFICIQLFIAEIADPRIRGALSSLLTLNFNIGILFGYITGTYLPWFSRCIVLMVFPIVFFIMFNFIPESPQHFLKIGETENAERSLRFYRNCRVGSDNEMELHKELAKLKEIAEQNKCEEKTKVKGFLNPVSLRAMSIGPALMAVSQFSGTFILVSYAGTIFKESGSNLSPNFSSIILGCLQISGTISTYFLIDRLGRRALLTISSGGAAIGLSIMGTLETFEFSRTFSSLTLTGSTSIKTTKTNGTSPMYAIKMEKEILVTGTQSYPSKSNFLYDKYVYAPINDSPMVVPVDETINKIFRPTLSTKDVEIVVAINWMAIMMIDDKLGSSFEPESLKMMAA